jgi:tRNA(fMet)-specific endonuclease VapC
MWMLDSNACIRYLNGRSRVLRDRLHAKVDAEICVCSIVKGELLFGAAGSTDPARTMAKQRRFFSRFRSFPFDDAAVDAYAILRSDLTRRGQLIGPNDMLIAAICISNGLTLVTRNVAEFGRVTGLLFDDWEATP